MDEGRLARAGRSDQRHPVAGFEAEGGRRQRGDGTTTPTVRHRQVLGRHDGHPDAPRRHSHPALGVVRHDTTRPWDRLTTRSAVDVTAGLWLAITIATPRDAESARSPRTSCSDVE